MTNNKALRPNRAARRLAYAFERTGNEEMAEKVRNGRADAERHASRATAWEKLPYLMSDAECAAFLAISRATFWRRVADGTLPRPIKLGGATRWKTDDLIAAVDTDALMEIALEAGAEDVVESDDSIDVVTGVAEWAEVKNALESGGFEIGHAEVSMEATTTVAVEGSDAEMMLKLNDALEDLDDVQQVYANLDISEEVLASLGD